MNSQKPLSDDEHPWFARFEIIDRKPTHGGREIVLCSLPDNGFTPYGTWRYYEDALTKEIKRSDGAYFRTLEEARKNFLNRR